jgi:para-nitrobenzyl esterase
MRKYMIAGGMVGTLVLGAGCAMVRATVAQPVVIDSGALEGVRDGELTVYKGVPFAAPPVGALRWRAPQPVTPWKGIRKADAFAPACMQKGVSMPGEVPPVISEDCLYLNIWVPPVRTGKLLPVLVWIPGGGYTNGSASMPLYWGDRLALKGVIVITVAYRLGPLGFLAYRPLTLESAHHTSGNYGLMDQIAALKWVQRNIADFGGDARQVTIAGQSAGGMSVCMLMASPLAHGLFQRAIAESGGLFEPLQLAPSYQLSNAERAGAQYARSLGAKSLAALRALPAARLLQGDAGAVSHPVIEPYVLPAAPYDVFVLGQESNVPVLIGSNAEESRALIDPTAVKASTLVTYVSKSLGTPAAFIDAIINAYPHRTDVQARRAAVDLETDLRFGWDMWTWARLQAHQQRSRVYYYNFRERPPFPMGSVYQGWGASHFAELWYVFDHLDQERWHWTGADRRLAEVISSYWTNFVKSGNPNATGLPHWPRYEGTDGNVLYLQGHVTVGTVFHLDRLGAIETVYSSLRRKRLGKSPSSDAAR